jgi:hypothetical protein
MIVYLWWKNTKKTAETLAISEWTVNWALKSYCKNKNTFFKTNYQWRMISQENQKLLDEAKKVISDSSKSWEQIDIMDVKDRVNRKYKKEVLNYRKTWWLVRKILECNYQKPFVKNHKQPEYAKEILSGRLRKALTTIWIKERVIDAESIKNKKTNF